MASLNNGVRILGVPFDAHSSFMAGAALGPQAIRKTLNQGSLNAATESGVMLNKPYDEYDAGDVHAPSGPEYIEPIRSRCAELLEQGYRVLSLGGDHSISYPLLAAYGQVFSQLQVLHIDAHPDLYDELKGNRYSNACPFARVMEEGLCRRLVQIGIRTLNPHQKEQGEKFGVEMVEMKDWYKDWKPTLNGPVYVSIDIDGIDPSFAPGVSHREPGGLTVRDVINVIHRIPGNVVGGDIVEFNPNQDVQKMTAQVAAKLSKELMGRMLLDNGR